MREIDVYCCKLGFWVYLLVSLVLVLFAGIASGLALGLLSFSDVDLEVLIKSGRPEDGKNAAKILPIVKNKHLLLCTLLIAKSLALEALPIFLDSVLPSWAAILLSVTLVMAFTEIIPQSVCARYGLSVGAKLSVMVQILLPLLYPVAFPSSKLLDLLLGEGHSALYRRAELKTLVDLHAHEAGKGGDLSRHETTIISGALDLTQKTAKDAMTPISETFTLDINSKLDAHTMGLIMGKGRSRIPICSGNTHNIIGHILVKNLIICRPEDETPVKSLTIRKTPRVQEDWPLYDILAQFQKGHSHMAVVVKNTTKTENDSKTTPVHDSDVVSTNLITKSTQAEQKGFSTTQPPSISANTSPFYSTDTEFPSPEITGMAESKESKRQRKNWCQGNENPVEEVIGIITMEDVIEELIQEEILDETDAYIDVRNKIRINLVPSGKSPGRNRVASVRNVDKLHPEGSSPLSSYTPILRSPLTLPYLPSPLIRPALCTSPSAPSITLSIKNTSTPIPHRFLLPLQVSKKSTYERLR